MELCALAEDGEEERSLRQSVGGYLSLPGGGHFALLPLNGAGESEGRPRVSDGVLDLP